MDRKVCRKCRFSGFKSKTDEWTGCNYIIYTGEKRPHNGDICYGFEPMIGQRGRPAPKPVQRKPPVQAQTPQMKPVPVGADDCFSKWLNIMM